MRRPVVYAAVRPLADWCLALGFAMVALPVVVGLAAGLKLTSKGPVFYTQIRLGRGGKPFRIVKLRTMTHDCEAKTGPVWSTARDPRVTRVGRLLRDTHLDELPQFWNVLTGDMSLVGPRPERPSIAARLAEQVPGFEQRLEVKPGVTGLAQLRRPADVDVSQVHLKLAHDLHYIRHRSALLDLRILVATAFDFLTGVCKCAGRVALGPDRVEPQLEFSAPVSPTEQTFRFADSRPQLAEAA